MSNLTLAPATHKSGHHQTRKKASATVKVTPSFFAKVKDSPQKDRFLYAYRKLFSLALWSDETFRRGKAPMASPEDRAYRQRTTRLYTSRPELNAGATHRPIELFWETRFSAIPGLEAGGTGDRTAREFWEEGDRLELWYFIPCNAKRCHEGTPLGEREHARIILRNWDNEPLIEATIEGKRLVAKVRAQREQARINTARVADSFTLVEAHRDAIHRTTYPPQEQLHEVALQMVTENEDKDFKPYTYIKDPVSGEQSRLNLPTVINDFMNCLERAPSITGEDTKDLHGNTYPNRIYGNRFNLVPKWIRNRFLFDGERIVALDLKALHPNIIASDYRKETTNEPPDLLIGDSHGKITDALNRKRIEQGLPPLDRKTVKEAVNLSFWNCQKEEPDRWSKDHKEARAEFCFLIEEQCPGFLRWHVQRSNELRFLDNDEKRIERRKKRKRPPEHPELLDPHRQISRLLNLWEVQLMAHAVRILRQQGITCDTAHDCLYVAQSHKQQAIDALNAACLAYGVVTYAEES